MHSAIELGQPGKWQRWWQRAVLIAAAVSWNGVAAQPVVRYTSNSKQSDVIVVAHQDDWQLFLGDVAAARAASGPTTFIYLTAGDDGRDSTYWLTREKAALRSTRIALGAGGRGEFACGVINARAHPIRECTLGDSKSFFLRLPDGKRNGRGFSRYGNQSMRKLRVGNIPVITAVDSSTTYKGWNDLAATVAALIDTSANESTTVHTMDPNVAVNPHDHFDHRIAGALIETLRGGRPWRVRYYVGYALSSRAPNRSNEQVRAKTALFLAYDEEVQRTNPQWSAYREHPAFYSQCLLRTYARSPKAETTKSGRRSPSAVIR